MKISGFLKNGGNLTTDFTDFADLFGHKKAQKPSAFAKASAGQAKKIWTLISQINADLFYRGGRRERGDKESETRNMRCSTDDGRSAVGCG